MFNTENLTLPMVQAAQAQKHVTVNEAFSKLDALVQLRLVSTTLTTPPTSSVDGQAYGVPEAANGAWMGKNGTIAIRINGGWEFVPAQAGWSGWDIENDQRVNFDGTTWVSDSEVGIGQNATTNLKVVEIEHDLSSGATNTTANIFPSHSLVFGVSARVTDTIIGSGATSWRLGVVGSDDRYGSGYGMALNSFAKGLTSHPQTYWADTPLLLSVDAGSFISGKVKLAAHIMEIKPPVAL